MRRDYTQLPNSKELNQILSTESTRVVLGEKRNKHYADFSTIIALLNYFELSIKLFETEFGIEEIQNEENRKLALELVEQLSKNILANTLKPGLIEILSDIYDYLSEEDDLEKSDIIFVFGSKEELRTDKAIELYKKGWSEKIFISGDKNQTPESVIHKQYAIQKGVPEKAFMIETRSISIPDNVKSSLNYLDKNNIDYNSVILVNSPFSQRRGWAHFNKWTKEGVRLIRVNSHVFDKYSRDNWFKQEDTLKVFLNELFKLKVAVSLNTA
jgi:hypothetical protein